MSEAEESQVEANPEDDILKEVGETDYTEESSQDNDFDVADLECVDEECDEKWDDRGRIKEASPKRSSRANRSSDHRYDPYKRRSHETLKKSKTSPSKINRDQQRRRDYLERKKSEKISAAAIDLDELEEIDSCEHDDDDTAFTTPSTTSGTTESSSATPLLDYIDHDEQDHWKRLQKTGTDLRLDEEDYPTLSEDIDAELLERLAQGNVNLLVSAIGGYKSNDSEPSEQSSIDLPTKLEASDKNGKAEGSREQETSPQNIDDEKRRDRRSRNRMNEEKLRKDRLPDDDGSRERAEKGRKVNDDQERQSDSASPSSGKSGDRHTSGGRKLCRAKLDEKDSQPGIHDRQNGNSKRGRDDDILPPSRKQIRNLLDQLVERNNRIRRQELTNERKRNHHEESGQSSKPVADNPVQSVSSSESRSSPQN